MENNYEIFFSDMLSCTMDDLGVGCTKLAELALERGYKIRFQSISAYARGTIIPSYEKARALLDILSIDISEEELLEILENSRRHIKEQKKYYPENNGEIKKVLTIRIKTKNISPDLTEGEGERYLNERIYQLFGKKDEFSNYVKLLITKDLREFILKEEDLKNEIN